MFKNSKHKAFTLSYDDGILSDIKTARICNRYGVKCTFNINPGLAIRQGLWIYNGFEIKYLTKDALKEHLAGHEIASNSYSHPSLDVLTYEECQNEMQLDKTLCTEWFGKAPVGMAYPMGTYSDTVVSVLEGLGYKYARTVKSTHSFDIQHDLLRFDPTCHHADEALFELAEEFIKADTSTDMLFYVWGHSYEFDADGGYDRLDRLCRMMAENDDVFCGTNAEVLLERSDD